VTEHWQLPPERVALVYHGIDDPDEAASVMPSSCAGLGPFVFTAGSVRPARGLEDLIGAAPALLRRNPALRIVIAGQADSSSRPYEIRMHRLAARLGVADAILWAGHLTQPEMAWAFKQCAVFVLTSRAEACPNVALEALSHGAPIVSTLQEPMPEFFLETAAYYRPNDPDDLAAQIERVMLIAAEGSVVSAQRREAARARAGEFSWARTADETVTQLQLAAGVRVHA
jgi:glycosyltransferase involved in cell wall biosynthesis